jgi:superfamily II DNA/RNA helicase
MWRVWRDNAESKPFMTKTTFKSMANIICRESLQALQDAGFTYMTQVQEAAIPIAVTGQDLIAKARTGTGKTLGFLMPSIERMHAKKYVVAHAHAYAHAHTRHRTLAHHKSLT